MANIPTTAWAETTPSGGDNLSAGDNRIREMKTQIREVIDVDHDFPSSGQAADVGQHKKVTLQEQADLGTGAVGATILGSQTVSGKGELVYTDEDDNDIQLTKGGVAYPSQSTVLADWSKIMELVYPIGSVVTLGVSTNPGTLFGVGTWTAIAGKVIVGINSGDAEFDTLDETGGAKTVTLASANMPKITPTVASGQTAYALQKNGTGSLEGTYADSYTIQAVDAIGSASPTPVSVLQPYITKYVWQRTA
jgi:hypothetical protein